MTSPGPQPSEAFVHALGGGLDGAVGALQGLPSWLLPLVLGLVLLTSGRRLYWLLLAAVGFVLGFTVLSQLASGTSTAAPWIAGLLGGLVGVLVAVFVQGALLAVVGAVLGAFTGLILVSMIEPPAALPWEWMLVGVAIVGAILGALVMRRLFFACLIVATSVLGAGLLVQVVGFLLAGSSAPPSLLVLAQPGLPRTALFVVLVVIGLFSQTRSRRRGDEQKRLRAERRRLEAEVSRARRSR